MNNVVLPELGEGIEKAVVAFWHVKQGDKVKSDEDIVEVVTDKASFNVAAGHKGILKEIYIKEGQEVRVGQALAAIN